MRYNFTDSLQLRLGGGARDGSGRVEVRKPGGEWGTICDDGFENKDATVICKMFGFEHGIAKAKAHFGEGSGSIWMDDLECTGDEFNVFDCKHNGWGEHNCEHKEDAGIVCGATSSKLIFRQ